MKKLMLKSLLLGFLALSVVACQEDLIPSTDPDTDVVNDLANQSDSDDCFELVFPLDMELPDGTTETVNDYEALEALYEAIEDEDEEPNFVFPLLVIDENGEELSVTEEELYELYEACEGMDEEDDEEDDDDHDSDDCFELVFPLDMELPDGTTETVNDYEALEALYEAIEDEDEEPNFVFPLLVIDENGEELSVTEEELYELYEACEGMDDEDDEEDDDCDDDDWFDLDDLCFELVLPITLEMPDGSELEIGPDMDIFTLIEEWYENHDEDWDEEPALIYPIEILYDDGSVEEIPDEEALEEAIEAC